MAKYTRAKVDKLKANRKVKGLIKALTYKRGEAFDWHFPESGGPINPGYQIALSHIEGEIEWVQHYGVRMNVAEALGEIGDERAVAPLVDVAENDNLFAVRCIAAEALERLGWQPDTGVAGATYWINKRDWDKCVELGEVAVPPLIDALVWDSASQRIDIGRTLARIGGPAVDALTETLHKWLRELIGMAAVAYRHGLQPLSEMGAVLIESAAGVSGVIESCAWALGETGDDRAAEALSTARATIQAAIAQMDDVLLWGYLHGEFLPKRIGAALTKLQGSSAAD